VSSSTGFFQDESNPALLPLLLAGTCSAPESCEGYLDTVVRSIDKKCSTEIKNRVSLVLQTKMAALAYGSMKTIDCLTDPDTGSYCFAEALNSTGGEDMPWYITVFILSCGDGRSSRCIPQFLGSICHSGWL
jgi:hypothetical protein